MTEQEQITKSFADLTSYRRGMKNRKIANDIFILLAALEAAEKERDELQQLIDLQHTRTIKADKLWRHAHPEQQHKSPDLGTLVDWLLFRAKRAEAYAAKLEKAGDFMRGACPIIIARDNWDVARKEKPGA